MRVVRAIRAVREIGPVLAIPKVRANPVRTAGHAVKAVAQKAAVSQASRVTANKGADHLPIASRRCATSCALSSKAFQRAVARQGRPLRTRLIRQVARWKALRKR